MGNVLVWTPPISIHIKNSSSPLYFSLKVWLLRPPSSTPLAFMDLLWGVFIFSPFAQSECWISISKPNSHKCKKYRHFRSAEKFKCSLQFSGPYIFLLSGYSTSLQCRRILASKGWIQTRKRLGERPKCVPGSGSSEEAWRETKMRPREWELGPLPTYFAQTNMAANFMTASSKTKTPALQASYSTSSIICPELFVLF